MSAEHPHLVRRQSVRVALGATALVAVVYLAIAIAVVAFVSADLIRQTDDRLAHALVDPHKPPPVNGGFEPPEGDRRYPMFLVWVTNADGEVESAPSTPALPAELQAVTSPQTVTLDGTEMRIVGATVGDDHVVIGQDLTQLAQTRSTLVATELLIAPILLLAVFFGAIVIGRRVAAPIELARQRQLDFTADASHELRTPLSVIEAQTSLALSHDREEAWYRTAFERVDRESKRMRRLLDDLLWLARFDATRVPPNVEPVDLGILAAQAADRFAVVAEARNLVLEVGGQDDGAVIAAPPEWLDRLLGVLLDNACKYSPDGGTVRVAVTTESGRVRLTVDDSGPGIPEDQRERIFDRFHRAIEGPAGAGLGLAIADAIVRATGGRWKVGRSPTNGARMAVSWPAALGGHREPAVASPRSRTAGSD
jgi:two-component system, OmpR family, sensor histidine kinase CiaH